MRWIAAGALIGLAFCGNAQAALTDYEAPAVKLWGAPSACPAGVSYVWFDSDPFAQQDGVEGIGRAYGCEMWLSAPFWASVRRVERCRLFLHEWGHLTVPGGDPEHRVLNTMGYRIGQTCRAWERDRWQRRIGSARAGRP